MFLIPERERFPMAFLAHRERFLIQRVPIDCFFSNQQKFIFLFQPMIFIRQAIMSENGNQYENLRRTEELNHQMKIS